MKNLFNVGDIIEMHKGFFIGKILGISRDKMYKIEWRITNKTTEINEWSFSGLHKYAKLIKKSKKLDNNLICKNKIIKKNSNNLIY